MISITKMQSIFKHMFVIIAANFGHKKSQALTIYLSDSGLNSIISHTICYSIINLTNKRHNNIKPAPTRTIIRSIGLKPLNLPSK